VELIIHVDGGARGNPGPAGAGVVIRDQEGNRIHEAGYFLGQQTNNVAEYEALIRALQRALRVQPQALTVYSDSELLVRQLTGEYQVRSPRLVDLHRQVQLLLIKVPRWMIRHVPRETNAQADRLANLAMDQQRDVIVYDAAGTLDSVGPPVSAEATAAVPAPPAAPADAAEAEQGEGPPHGRPAVRVTVSTPPRAGSCPAGGFELSAFTICSRLPTGLCVHAAHAILPTVLAMMNTEPSEFNAIPTMTVRCAHAGCNAVFQISAVRGSNGSDSR